MVIISPCLCPAFRYFRKCDCHVICRRKKERKTIKRKVIAQFKCLEGLLFDFLYQWGSKDNFNVFVLYAASPISHLQEKNQCRLLTTECNNAQLTANQQPLQGDVWWSYNSSHLMEIIPCVSVNHWNLQLVTIRDNRVTIARKIAAFFKSHTQDQFPMLHPILSLI